MLNKKLIILTIFFVSFLAVSAVNAAYNATDDAVSVEETNDEIVDVSEDQSDVASDVNKTTITNEVDSQIELNIINDIKQSGAQEIIKGRNVGTFTDLKNNIATEYGSEIKLEEDYEYEGGLDTDWIKIEQSIIIDGQGHKIDAKGKTGIFWIASKANNVILKNISFVNGKTNIDAGAIYWEGDDGLISDCIFENNSADDSGGAIRWYNGDNGKIFNCTFLNNSAEYGGAIEWDYCHNGLIYGCSFINNTGAQYGFGGAVRICEEIFVSNCTFENNSAEYGGAISGGHISDCIFINNSAKFGGASAWVSVSDCMFINNHAANGGGAIYAGTNDKVFNCSLINNHADNGGAIEWYGSNGIVSNCIFVNITSNKGIIYFFNSYGDTNLTINNNIFLNNHAKEIYFVEKDSTSNTDYNWFGHTATNYTNDPNLPNCNMWLFLNATVIPHKIPILSIDDIIFNFYLYNSTSNEISKYDASLKPINLTITATNGNITKNMANIGDTIEYSTNSFGKGSVAANIENVQSTIEFDLFKFSNPFLSINPQEFVYGQNTIMHLNYDDAATGNVNITLKGNKNNYIFKNITLNKTIVFTETINADEYNVTVFYLGDDNFAGTIVSSTLKIIKANSTLTINDTSFDYSTTGSINVSFTNASRIIAEIIGQTQAAVNITDNLISISNLNSGNYNLTVTTITDNNHNPITKTIRVVVKMDCSDVEISKEIVNFEGTLSFDLPIGATGIVTITIGNKNYTTNVTNGAVNMNLSDLENGEYSYIISYSGDEEHSSFKRNGTLIFNKLIPTIKSEDRVIDYGTAYDFKATFFDKGGSSLSNAYVIFEVNGKEYVVKTDSYGTAILNLGLTPGKYTIFSINMVTGERKNNTLIVNKKITSNTPSNANTQANPVAKTTLTLKTVKVKKSAKKLVLQATLKQGNKALSGKKITFKFNGKKYTTKTNKKGVAKLTIKKNVLKKLKVGKKITYSATYGKVTKKVTVKVKK